MLLGDLRQLVLERFAGGLAIGRLDRLSSQEGDAPVIEAFGCAALELRALPATKESLSPAAAATMPPDTVARVIAPA
jgi:hypothetical protein